jgi:hypothetical protein
MEYSFESDGQRPPEKIGHQKWSDAYERLLLEVRDEASRKKISSIPFHRLHKQFERFRCILDHVMRPRLIALSGGDDSITLVQRWAATVGERHTDSSVAPWAVGEGAKDWIQVTGFRDWSNLVFGDPLIAKVFCLNPSKDTIIGYTGDSEVASFSPALPAALIDDRRHVKTRLLLYQCYWTIKEIVRQPMLRCMQGDRASKPSPAWMELSDTLARLESITSPTYTLTRRSRKLRARKRRRSESPAGDGLGHRDWASRSPQRSWFELRRCSTP